MEKGRGAGDKHDNHKDEQAAPEQYGKSERYLANGARHEEDNASHTSQEFDWEQPPAYEFHGSGPDVKTEVTAQDDGRIAISFAATDKLKIPIPAEPKPYTPPNVSNSKSPPLNIVIQIVGSRGDIQPFIALGTALRAEGHRVRIATHDVFRDFVRASGLEFFPIGGDPTSLMAYMVKNPGIIPKFRTIMSGEITKKRKMVFTMLEGCWRSCIEPDPETNIPFVAEAIIANPPSFAHVHCSEALGIPLHMMFTMPWSPTRAFPHPLANIERSNADLTTMNFLSYALVEIMTWQGLGDVVNLWRRKSLSLEDIPLTTGPLLCDTLQIPFTYCWSPAFVPKPADWSNCLDVCGFFFREEPDYTPDAELDNFLRSGPPPVYIGFGSIVIDDPERMTNILVDALRACGTRAIISRGWSKLGSGLDERANPDILFLGGCPHEWLFKHVSCVVHHGGAGTTACGLLNGCPTAVVPFFGDQAFWGQMIAAAGAGPLPLHHKSLNQGNLTQAIEHCLTPAARSAAAEISEQMRRENGVQTAVQSFHTNLPVEALRCDILPDQAAVWQYKIKNKKDPKKYIKLSDEAAFELVERKKIDPKRLKLYRSKPLLLENLRWEPISAGTKVLLDTMTNFTIGFSEIFTGPAKAFQSKENGGGGKEAAKTLGMGFGKMVGVLPKATLVDFPLALTEGLHQMPRLYGDSVRNHGKVKDWKSGGIVAGKNFGYGFMDGISGAVTKPYKGAKENGWAGFGTGLAKGVAGLVAGPGSGMFGLFAYPFLGMYKSITTSAMSPTEQKIMLARQVYGSYMARQRDGKRVDSAARQERVLAGWEGVKVAE